MRNFKWLNSENPKIVGQKLFSPNILWQTAKERGGLWLGGAPFPLSARKPEVPEDLKRTEVRTAQSGRAPVSDSRGSGLWVGHDAPRAEEGGRAVPIRAKGLRRKLLLRFAHASRRCLVGFCVSVFLCLSFLFLPAFFGVGGCLLCLLAFLELVPGLGWFLQRKTGGKPKFILIVVLAFLCGVGTPFFTLLNYQLENGLWQKTSGVVSIA